MSAHPNVILLLTLTPQDLARKTMREILVANGIQVDDEYHKDDDVKIGGAEYHHEIMESDYNDSWQISGKEGDLLFFDLVTYGYGEQIKWEKLEAQKRELEEWAKSICDNHHCTYQISVAANYW